MTSIENIAKQLSGERVEELVDSSISNCIEVSTDANRGFARSTRVLSEQFSREMNSLDGNSFVENSVLRNKREFPNEIDRKFVKIARRLSRSGSHPFDAITWVRKDAKIVNERGETVFNQENVEVPEFWSQMAVNVVVSKYFRGGIGKPERETSVKQLVSRVANTIADWGFKSGYFESVTDSFIFRDELLSVLVHQYGAFNSPVWFNVGILDNPQCSACFILSVQDSMESLLELQRAEAMLFKYGSGAGSNLSAIRSSKETLSGGGVPSGPVSFMRAYDSWAGTIKSGGKTRRAAKMQILDVDHPDIEAFVNAKKVEEQKAWALIEGGYSGGFNVPGGAYDSVSFQNANLSVRVSDAFMNALLNDEVFYTRKRTDASICDALDPKKLMMDISHGTWLCGDPGLQFDDTINAWHTCPNSGRINASNPCSEYMHIDDTACNLASVNLLKFLDSSANFDIASFKHVIDLFILSQEIIVGNASYPTDKIAANSIKFRQLGLGFANLGALLMSLGVAYDSDPGRALSASIMSLVTGESYLMSAKIAESLGAFDAYEENIDAMKGVIYRHKCEADRLAANVSVLRKGAYQYSDSGRCVAPWVINLETLKDESRRVWEQVVDKGNSCGFRNSQVSVLAPTGTIAFLMDCDTTGIEPDIALVKYKSLVGGGVLKIVNQSVSRGLVSLGYTTQEVADIIRYIEDSDTIEGAPHIEDRHLEIFDCAFKPSKGKRYIHYMGHIKMMAAVQPFVSGAISKTVNLPEHATVIDIYDTYVEAWKLGLKAVAIYRDNSKRSQPLVTSKDGNKGSKELRSFEIDDVKKDALVYQIERRHLPDERNAVTHKFNIAGHEGYITVGLYDDNSPGEIFIVMAKEGSTLSGVMDAFATSVSLALQYGVPLSALVRKFAHMRFEPSGFTSSAEIPHAKSLLDYIFRWMGMRFLTPEEQISSGICSGNTMLTKEEDLNYDMGSNITQSKDSSVSRLSKNEMPKSFLVSKVVEKMPRTKLPYVLDDAPPCSMCGSSMMVRQGACYRCLNCGSQGGCG